MKTTRIRRALSAAVTTALALLMVLCNRPSVYLMQGKDHQKHVHFYWLVNIYAAWSPCSLTALASSWTCVDGTSSFANGGTTSYNGTLSSAINVGDLFVGWVACSGTPTACDSPIASFSTSDNDSTSFSAWPPGAKINGADSAHGAYEFFYGCASVAKASGYQFTAGSSANIEDYAIAHFRWTGTGAGSCPTLETANGTGSSGTGQSVFFSNSGSAQSSFSGGVTTTGANALVIGGQNMGGMQSNLAAGWTPVDQSMTGSPAPCNSGVGVPFCAFVADVQVTPGAITLSWQQTTGNGLMQGILAFDPPGGGGGGGTARGFDKRRKLEKLAEF